MRLWVPPLFVILNNFRVYLRQYYPDDEFITMCEMLYPRIQKLDYASCNYTLVKNNIRYKLLSSASTVCLLILFMKTSRICSDES